MPSSNSAETTGTDPRPLSPHLQVYRWQITMVMSIVHRITGIMLAGGTLLLVWWLVALAMGPVAYGRAQNFISSPIGILMMFGWTVALFYHLCNGIRHLVWDTGRGLDLKSVYAGGWIVLAATAGLTVLAWALGCWHWRH